MWKVGSTGSAVWETLCQPTFQPQNQIVNLLHRKPQQASLPAASSVFFGPTAVCSFSAQEILCRPSDFSNDRIYAARVVGQGNNQLNTWSRRAASALLSFFGKERSTSSESAMADKWWSANTVAVVTGANKGIGFHIARRLATQGLTTVVAARNPSLGEEACRKLREEGLSNLHFCQLDLTDPGTIDAFAEWVQQKFGGIDILVNNAGFAHKGNTFGAEEAEYVLGVNYEGTRAVCERLLPLLRASPAGARIVNVCSMAGKLRIVSPELQARFTDPNLTPEQLSALVSEFPAAIAAGTHRQKGWPNSMYGISKLAEATYTRILDRQLASRPDGQKVYVNACCPGWCATDMSSWGGRKTADEGADTPVFLALSPPTSGGFFSERKQEPF